MKAIIPVAGAGTRLRPFTYTQPKALIPVAGKPIISYIIEELQTLGVKEFVFIVGYLGDKIVDYLAENQQEISYEVVYQNQREGLGHAIYQSKEYVKENEEIVIILGDSIIDIEKKHFLKANHSVLGIKKVEDPCNFGVATINEEGRIVNLVEKPKIPTSNWALVGLYRIVESSMFFEILEQLIKDDIRTNGEIQLTDALIRMIDKGVTFETYRVNNWLDVGQGDILLDSNAILLKKRGSYISPKAVTENLIIIDPVNIADNATIKNAIIGPNVTIGEHTTIKNAILKDGIVGSYTSIKGMQLHNFVIGSDSDLKGSYQTLTVGDNTELDLSK
jgi:glucose-1-phosphate thymidylyltransferase